MLSNFAQDLRYGARKLWKSPAFTFVAVLTLAIGIGANTVMFGIVDALLFRPPAEVADASRLARVELELQTPNGPPQMSGVLAYPDFVNVRDRARGLARTAAFARTSIQVGQGEDTRTESVLLASGDYFSTLGVRPAAGRLIAANDDRDGAAAPVAVLGWEYFQRAYAGDATRALGSSVVLNGHPYTIIGVAPRHFAGIDAAAPALWVPLGTAPDLGYDSRMVRSRYAQWLVVVGRLAPHTTKAQAQASVQSALLAARDEGAELPPTGLGPGGAMPGAEVRIQIGGPGGNGQGGGAAPARRARLASIEGVASSARAGGPGVPGGGGQRTPVSLWFLAVTGTVLLIACANVANLLLVRAANRSHEIAVRLSIGATRARLASQLLTESLLLAALGGAAAVAVAIAGASLLPSLLPLPALPEVVDRRAILFTAGVAALTTLAFGLAPAWRAARQELNAVLGAAGRSRAGRSLGRDALVVVQLGASLALLVAAGLFVRSLRNVKAVDTGFAADQLLLATADVRGGRFTREQGVEYWAHALERVKTIPGVRGASLGVAMPFQMNITLGVDIPRVPSPDGRPRPTSADFVGPEFFATAGIPVVRGRAFTADDRETGAPVAIVNQTFARRYLRGIDPLSACIAGGGDSDGCMPIIGVVADAHYGDVTREPEPFMYRPIAQRSPHMPPVTMMYVRTSGDPAVVAGAVRRELQALDPRVAFATVREMTALIEPQLAPWRIGTFIFTLFGVLGALLAAVGLYGVVSFVVTQRTREFGVRLALGAQTGDVMSLVLRQGGRLVAIGLVIGAVVAAVSTRLFVSLMFGVSALDPIVYVGMAVLLAIVAFAASYVPALRATRVDPIEALRSE
jgi:putative ABC transport system permease protein